MLYKNLFLIISSFYCITFCSQSNQQFAWDGEKYDKNSERQYNCGLAAIESFNLRGDEKVLDIGCGNGKITSLCAQRLPAGFLTAIDISPSMLAFAKKNYGDANNINFLFQDVVTMTYEEEFDFIYSIFCLHWVKEPEIAMKNIARALKPGGQAVAYISLPNEFNITFKEVFTKLINSSEWNNYKESIFYTHFPITTQTWLNYAEQNNLKTNFNTTCDKIVYETYDAFKKRFTAFGLGSEILGVMGNEIGNCFIDDCLEQFYHALGLTLNDPIIWQSDRLILTLIK